MTVTRASPDRDQAAAGTSEWAVFLDFDGTLVEIADRPDAVVVPADLTATLRALESRLHGALAIVTGRPIATIDEFLVPERFDVAGVHGAEYRLAGRSFGSGPDDHPELQRCIQELHRRFASEPGILIEDKGCSVGVHWRLAPEAEDIALSAIREVAAALGPAYRLQHGKAVAEVLPSRASKGAIIEHYLNDPPYRGRRPIFAGDDLTDEQAFAAVDALDGISIRIGAGPTRARYRVGSPTALRQLLAQWTSVPHIAFDGMAPADAA